MIFNNNNISFDKIILSPDDIDLSFSPMKSLGEETYVLGVFNPGMSRLPNGNIILMVRVAEALRDPVSKDCVKALRWDTKQGFITDAYPLDKVDISDPRHLVLTDYSASKVMALTSMSWILPVELDSSGKNIETIHYDKIISSCETNEEYGIEDARISLIDGKYYMTTCTVSSERHATKLFSSTDGLNYKREGIILDHQNKDMLLFEGKENKKYYALTRPLGALYFATPINSEYAPGPGINLATSPDLLHWKPSDNAFIRQNATGKTMTKLGGGAQPILTSKGWMVLFHGVKQKGEVGVYDTYLAVLKKDDPETIIYINDKDPILSSNPALTEFIKEKRYLDDVVFTTGVLEADSHFIIASGELDLCVRITFLDKTILENI